MNFKKTTLPNGVRVITIPMPGNPTVTVSVDVCTGSFYEDPEQSGISHFLEHVSFKGTLKRPTPRIITTELDSIGAAYNASTSRNVTSYWVKADIRHFAKIADIVSDIYLNSTFPEKEIEKEKGVIVGEIDMYADDPQEKIAEVLGKHMYKGEPAERDILGTKEVIRGMTRDALVAYRKSQYTGPNTIVTIAGGISEKEMADWAEKSFSRLSSTEPSPELLTRDREQVGPETVFIDKDTDQSHIIMAWRTFNKSHPDRYTSRIIRNLLRGGMSSRLFTRLREEMGSGYYIGAVHALYTSFGLFCISTGTAHDRVPEIVKAIIEETDRLKSELVTQVELDKIKEYMRAHRLMSLETSDDVADFCGGQEAYDGHIHTPEELEAIFSKITAEDVVRVSNLMFARNRLTVAAIGKGIDKETVRSIITG